MAGNIVGYNDKKIISVGRLEIPHDREITHFPDHFGVIQYIIIIIISRQFIIHNRGRRSSPPKCIYGHKVACIVKKT